MITLVNIVFAIIGAVPIYLGLQIITTEEISRLKRWAGGFAMAVGTLPWLNLFF